MPAINHIFLDQTAYDIALEFQEALFNRQVENKSKNEATNNYLIFLEHNPVYTLGKSGDERNLKVSPEDFDADFYRTSRGGDITYHGPGQLTLYPIFNLDDFNIGVRQYVESLEQCIIDCIGEYGIKGERLEGASGVWIDATNENARKICAVGIKVSRGITMHGLAFNINTDLSYFDHIIPCGIDDKAVTSLEKELGKKLNWYEVLQKVEAQFDKHFLGT